MPVTPKTDRTYAMHMTNLQPIAAGVKGVRHAPCVAPGTTEIQPAPYVVIDHETDDGYLECLDGDEERYFRAWLRAGRIISEIRSFVPRSNVGWYGWPYPRQLSHVDAFANRFESLLGYADFLAPCCYVIDGMTPAQHIERAHLQRQCIELMRMKSKPIYPFVADCTLDGRRVCDDHDLHTQCQMARILGAKHVYVWSAMQYHTWSARLLTDESTPANVIDNVSRSRASLIGTYGFALDKWTADNVEREERRYTRSLLQRVKLAWKETA